jgi:hypothetical protein
MALPRLYQGFPVPSAVVARGEPARGKPWFDNDDQGSNEMIFKLAAIIGGVLLMAGVALAGTLTSLDSTNSPTVGTTPPPATTTVRQDDRGQEDELRGRENEPNEDVRGPCDEAEHAGDPRCTGAAPPTGADDDAVDDRGSNSGPGSDHSGGHDDPGGLEDSSGHGGGDNSGHGGGHDD